MPYVQADDAELYYETHGNAGSPVLLIMGFGVPGHLWLNQVDAFTEHHRVAWFDNCGAGATRARRRLPYSTRDLARHAAEVMDAIGWQSAHVVGVSMGGMIAQELALGFRERVRSLSLVVTHGGGLRNMIPAPRALALFVRGFLGPSGGRVRALERLIYPEEYLATVDRGAVAAALRDEVASAASRRERLNQIAVVLRHDSRRRLRELAGLPTLVVRADRDVLVHPRACHRLHESIPGSRLVAFADAGHAVVHQCADRLNRELLAHFRCADAERP